MKSRLARSVALSCLVVGMSLAAAAGADNSTLGSGGVLFTSRTGTYGQLFPGATDKPAHTQVLGLDIQGPEGSSQRLLVPGSQNVAANSQPFVLFENASGRLFLVWEGFTGLHSAVNLITYDGARWSEVLKISGHPFTQKTAPRLATTFDQFRVHQSDGTQRVVERTTLHVVWYEDDYDRVDVLYSPVVLENGELPELLPPILRLGEFAEPALESGESLGPSAELLRSPRIVPGPDNRSVLVAFADGNAGGVATLRLDLLPRELSDLADDLERFLEAESADPCGNGYRNVTERARAHLVLIGRSFNDFARDRLATELADWMLARAGKECNAVAGALSERARAYLVLIGRRALREALVTSTHPAKSWTVRVEGPNATTQADLVVGAFALRSTPSALVPGPSRIHVGNEGRTLLVSWLAGQRLIYQEHDGTGWTEAQALLLSDSFTLDQAYRVLDLRAK
jgi:hypothetical protein